MRAAREELDAKDEAATAASGGSRSSRCSSRASASAVPGRRCGDRRGRGDHGYADEGVSAYPAGGHARRCSRTSPSGGAAISVLARDAGAELVVVDAGAREPFDDPSVRSRPDRSGHSERGARAGDGAGRGSRGDRRRRRARARARGPAAPSWRSARWASATRRRRARCTPRCSAAAPAPCAAGAPGSTTKACGARSTVVERALAANAPLGDDPIGVLAALGGFEIAFLVGVALGAAAERAGGRARRLHRRRRRARRSAAGAGGDGVHDRGASVARAGPPAFARGARAPAAARPRAFGSARHRRGARVAAPPSCGRDPPRDGDLRERTA